jgi:ubiquinol oxidase
MDEAENERMHLTFIELAKPTAVERDRSGRTIDVLCRVFGLYLVSPHRRTGWWAISKKRPCLLYAVPGGMSGQMSMSRRQVRTYKLTTMQRCDVVLVVRADEAHHRDVNHGLASALSGLSVAASVRK